MAYRIFSMLLLHYPFVLFLGSNSSDLVLLLVVVLFHGLFLSKRMASSIGNFSLD